MHISVFMHLHMTHDFWATNFVFSKTTASIKVRNYKRKLLNAVVEILTFWRNALKMEISIEKPRFHAHGYFYDPNSSKNIGICQ